MMKAVIVRHADAGKADPRKYPDDALRPLSDEGEKEMAKVARGMVRLGIEIEDIFDSGFERARQTANCICEAYKIDPTSIRVIKSLQPDAEPAKTAAELRVCKDLTCVALVGHMPQLGKLIGYLLAGNTDLALDLKKGAVCLLDVERWSAGGATMTALLPPKALRKLAK
ncbi:MAG: phosphohistidine phosphatase SixA [Candidatus Eremiobacteraeota bacterium]|nr:phosphohistidine phosphatase SixA [Candidatus Eremiobacteraeota bacterium]MBV8366959.1 phosphohistidine phosphatase SixA [Candidatus Eremiobacteraeota bacterium]